MIIEIPDGYRFEFNETSHGSQLSWFDCKKGWEQIGVGLFLMFWLGGWVVGEIFAVKQILEDMVNKNIDFDIVFWLAGWTIGGTFALVQLFNLFGPIKCSRLVFMSGNAFLFEQGSYLRRFIDSNGNEQKNVKRGKKHGVFEHNQIANLQIERVGERQRLTNDYKSNRIEVGKGLSEPEREWLYNLLKKHIKN